jgi:hypothetical protein
MEITMDLTNKQVQVDSLSINNLLREVVAKVSVYVVLDESTRKVFDTFEIKLEGEFLGPSDPALLAAITSKLETL